MSNSKIIEFTLQEIADIVVLAAIADTSKLDSDYARAVYYKARDAAYKWRDDPDNVKFSVKL